MSLKNILVCIQAVFVQVAFSQCWAGPEYAPSGYGQYHGLAAPFAHEGICSRNSKGIYPAVLPSIEITPTSSGMTVTSGSAVPPSGLAVVSDNAYEGHLAVAGELPFVGTTATEGMLPSVGSGDISHSCGSGLNAVSALSLASSPASVVNSDYGVPYGVSSLASGLPVTGFAAPGFAAPGQLGPGFAAPGITDFSYAGKPFVTPTLPCDEDFLETPLDIEFTPTNSENMPIASASAVPPTGLAVVSETSYEGSLAVVGELPFVGTVGVEGVLPTAGAGAVNHHCGDGINAMISDNSGFTLGSGAGLIPPGAFGPGAFGLAAPGYGHRGWAGRGYGCGL